MTSLCCHDIILVLFWWIFKQDYKNNYLVTGNWSQSTWSVTRHLMSTDLCTKEIKRACCLSCAPWGVYREQLGTFVDSLCGQQELCSALVSQLWIFVIHIGNKVRLLMTALSMFQAELQKTTGTETLPKFLTFLEMRLCENEGGDGFVVGKTVNRSAGSFVKKTCV